jgi:hypothetical protein
VCAIVAAASSAHPQALVHHSFRSDRGPFQGRRDFLKGERHEQTGTFDAASLMIALNSDDKTTRVTLMSMAGD